MRWAVLLLALLVACSESASTTASSTPAESPSGEVDSLLCWSGEPDVPVEGSWIDATDELGLVEPLTGMRGHAASVGDVNGDGQPDLFVGTFGDRPPEDYAVRGAEGPRPDTLLLGADFSEADGWKADLARTSGSIFADLDADGDEDLVVIRNAGVSGDSAGSSVIYENSEGTLDVVTTILPGGFRGRTPAVADFDGDGLLDLYVTEDRYGETGGLLFRNKGSFEFEDVTTGSGVEGRAALSAATGDLDGDRRPDLVLSTGVFMNAGDWKFEETTPTAWTTDPLGAEDDPAGVAIGDLNGDGHPDVVIGQHFRSTLEFEESVPVSVFFNDGAGELENVTVDVGVSPLPTLAPHVAIVDVNNDSSPDIVTSASVDDGAQPAVFVSSGGRSPQFELRGEAGSAQYWVGAPAVDFDLDGRIDLLAVEWEPTLGSKAFVNALGAGDWIEISVAGPNIGVGVVVELLDSLGETIATSEIAVPTGYSSSSAPLARFGLGEMETVEMVLHFLDGTRADLGELATNAHYRWPVGCG